MRSPNAVAALIRDAGRRAASDEPLGRAVYDGLRRLREEPRGERLHTIVTRCDLGGEPHKSVAADLAISRRQFYRDLDAARRRLAELLDRPPSEEDRIGTGWRLAVSLSLTAEGRFDAAKDLLGGDGVIDDAPEGAAWQLIGHAQSLQNTGRSALAVPLLERCLERFVPGRDVAATSADVRGLAYTMLTFCYFEIGELRKAVAIHERNPAAASGAVSTMVRRQYLNVDAMLACDGRAGTARAKAICIAFHRFAVEHGYVEEIASSLALLASIARFEHRYAEAESLARESLAIDRATGTPLAPIVGMLAGIAVDRGDSQAAIELARETRVHASTGSHAWWASHLFEAEAANLRGQSRAALRICAVVERDAAESESRILSWTRRVQAAALSLEGETLAARGAVEAALEIAGPDGPANQRLKNLLVAERLSPRSAHRDEIQALTALFGLIAPG